MKHNITSKEQLEREIIESKKRYQLIVETQQEMICHYLPDTTLIFVNQPYCRAFSMSESELIGRKFLEHTPPDYQEKLLSIINSLTPEKPAVTHEHQAILADGTLCWQEWTDRAIFDESGEVVEYQAIGRDITERKLAEEALAESLARYDDLVASVPVGIYVVYIRKDGSMDFDYVSDRWCEIHQLKRDAVLSNISLANDQVHPDELEEFLQCNNEAFINQKPFVWEGRFITGNGDLRWLRLESSPAILKNGDTRWFGVTQDITERKNIEEALQSRERFLSTILKTTIDGFLVVDNQQRITMVNDAYCAMSGYNREELLSMTTNDLDVSEKPEETAARIKRICEKGSELFQTCHRHKDGTLFPLEISVTCLPENGGQFICFCRDITERKQIEATLRRQASERAAVDAFTNSVSHDLQAPLRRIKGFSEALMAECAGQLSDQASDYLRRINRQIDAMKDLTDGLLQLSLVVSQDLKIEEVNLSALALSHLEKLRRAEPARPVETVVAPEMKAMGDSDLVNVALEKLLENAWKFTAGAERAHIECGAIEEIGRTVYFVRDNGVGFDQQHSAELFMPFQKLHDEEDYPGIGIGLNMAYRIINRHGGEFWAKSEPGKGACFYFTLPS
jgi:PAS domain S-box-containing protein